MLLNPSDFFALYGTPVELASKLIRKFLRLPFLTIHALQRGYNRRKVAYLLAPGLVKKDRAELDARLKFYAPNLSQDSIVERQGIDLPVLLAPAPILIFGHRSRFTDWVVSARPGTFNVDFRAIPFDGWEWASLADYVSGGKVDFELSRRRLAEKVVELKRQGKEKCYLFGTGPSLENINQRRWEDGYRVVCNTIVRDPVIWEHLCPNFIVAGDAIYHFGHTGFARAFRKDLRDRLQDSDTLFLYPAQFHAIVVRELDGLEEHLVPIPTGWRRRIDIDLTQTFRLPNLGNVLGLLLLPLACTLSKNICLWGFDGRGPNDKFFWSNSSRHTYPEYMDELHRSHPRFFEHHIPASNPNKYVQDYQGDRLELVLQLAEKNGWRFEMLHPSWTPTLQKRFRET